MGKVMALKKPFPKRGSCVTVPSSTSQALLTALDKRMKRGEEVREGK